MISRTPDDDTSDDARRLLTDRYARMSPAEKLRCVQQITRAADLMALAGERQRHPNLAEPALLARLARRRLGDALYDAAYGPDRTAHDA